MFEYNVSRNDEQGLQVEMNGVLLTITNNPDHGIAGSLSMINDKNDVESLAFHGGTRQHPFPLVVHEPELLVNLDDMAEHNLT